MTKKVKQLEDGTLVLETVSMKLPVKLDQETFGTQGLRLANQLQQQGEFEDEAKRQRDVLKKQGDRIQADIDATAQSIRTGVMQGDVLVEIRADFAKGFAEFVRLDTGETLTKRQLTDNERQQRLVFNIEGTDKAADKAIEEGTAPIIDINALAKPVGEMTKGEKAALAAEANKPQADEPSADA